MLVLKWSSVVKFNAKPTPRPLSLQLYLDFPLNFWDSLFLFRYYPLGTTTLPHRRDESRDVSNVTSHDSSASRDELMSRDESCQQSFCPLDQIQIDWQVKTSEALTGRTMRMAWPTTGRVVDLGGAPARKDVQPMDRVPFSAFPEHARLKVEEFDENHDGRYTLSQTACCHCPARFTRPRCARTRASLTTFFAWLARHPCEHC